MPPLRTAQKLARNAGAVLVLSIIAFIVLILMVALVIDGGLIYGKRAEISKAVDAAAIAAINSLPQGQALASQAAIDIFNANYRMTSRDNGPPSVGVQWGVAPNGSTTVDVRGTVHLRTLFLQIIPEYADGNFDVRASAQAMRSKLVMSIVLDRSKSMRANSGCIGLPPAVDTFIGFFDDQIDRCALVTFASNARTDVPMRANFRSAIMAATPRNCDPDYDGYTYFDGGLQRAHQENEGVVVTAGEQVVKVVVFFTDGYANTFQGTFDCPPPGTVWNLTSGDVDGDADNTVHVLDPGTGLEQCWSTPENGGPLPCCPNLTTFQSITGATRSAVGSSAGADVRAEARDCARERARLLREAGNTVYTIGLGTVDQDFLKEIANDRTSPAFDPSQPVGEFAYAPTAADLQRVFQKIARRILVRISI